MTYAPGRRISGHHDTDVFDCGSSAQTGWLRRHALQADRAGSTRVQVVTRQDGPRVVGYYALSAGSVEPASAPVRVAKGMPPYPMPVVILTRLGVDLSEQGRGLGRMLAKDALLRAIAAAEEIGVRAILIHCEDAVARDFYLHLAEFEASPSNSLHLFLLMGDARKSMQG